MFSMRWRTVWLIFRREVRDQRCANEILKAASVFFARELDQPTWMRRNLCIAELAEPRRSH